MTHPKLPSIGIIVLNWKQPQLTAQTIKSLTAIQTPTFSYHIYLVDNHSDDGSYQYLAKLFLPKNITLSQTSENLGFVGGNNFGISQALENNCDYVLIINNDVLVDPQFLIHLVADAESDPTIGLVGPKIYFAPGHEFHHHYKKNNIGRVIWSAGGIIDWQNVLGHNIGIDEVDSGQYDQPREVDFLSGCCLLVKSKIFRTVGLLNNDYFMYLEDDEFCQRVKKAGFSVHYQPKSVIWHINAGSSRAGGGSLHDYFLTRNRLIFGYQYASTRTKVALIRDSIRRLFIGTNWQRRGVIDYYLHRWGRGSWPQK